MSFRLLLLVMFLSVSAFSQAPPQIEPGVSQELAKWRAARYSNVRYKLNLTLEKMSPVLKGTMEIRVTVGNAGSSVPPAVAGGAVPIILDWRKIRGHEEKSTISNVSINGRSADTLVRMSVASTRTGTDDPQSSPGKNSFAGGPGDADKSVRAPFEERDEHLIFSDGVVMGENVIKLDFTSPILTSGSAITRYVDKEDGSEYLYSLFVPSDASTAFPVFDQPDIKARFSLRIQTPEGWKVISNEGGWTLNFNEAQGSHFWPGETKPISTYVFAFAAGPWERVSSPHVSKGSVNDLRTSSSQEPSLTVGLPTPAVVTGGNASVNERVKRPSDAPNSTTGNLDTLPNGRVSASDPSTSIYVRKSQAAKFKPHAAEVFRLNREAVRYFEEYFDYKFPFPKYDLVLIPEFPFGGMEHAGATFLREASIIFPQEPTKNDHISRATLIFHEASHQWFGDTVTMRWFDDLWLKEGFATFTAYKAMEKIMPEMNAWKVFYERVKQAAYQTDSTKGTTAIYQPIANLSAAKSAYGNIVYNKAPAFLRQAEFYLGEDKFQAAVRAFLKKHEFGNAGWEDLLAEFERNSINVFWKRSGFSETEWAAKTREFEKESSGKLTDFASFWIKQPGVLKVGFNEATSTSNPTNILEAKAKPSQELRVQLSDGNSLMRIELLVGTPDGKRQPLGYRIFPPTATELAERPSNVSFVMPNYQDYGYGIFLLDDKSREYVLRNIQNEKDPFLRSMMWGALWDSVREGELDPREYVELVVRVLSTGFSRQPPKGGTQDEDESTTALLLNRVGTAMNYYIDDKGGDLSGSEGVSSPTDKDTLPTGPVSASVEDLLISGMRNAETLGQRITYYRAFLNIASSEKARSVLKDILNLKFEIRDLKLKTKDKFDIVTKLLILNDPEAPKLLAELEKSETSDDAKRYAYAARAGIPTAENKAKYWNDFVSNKDISESWIEAAFGPWNSIRHSELTLGYLERALKELPNHKRNRKIFFVNGWLGAFIGGQRSEEALAIVNKFLADNPSLDNDLRLKILENVDVIERAVRIRKKF